MGNPNEAEETQGHSQEAAQFNTPPYGAPHDAPPPGAAIFEYCIENSELF